MSSLKDMLALMRVISDTTNTITGMTNLNDEIALNQQKLDYTAKIRETERNNQLNRQTAITTAQNNLNAVNKDLDTTMNELQYHDATKDAIYKDVQDDLRTDEVVDLFGDEDKRFESDLSYISEVKGTWQEQLTSNVQEYHTKNKMLEKLEKLRNEIDLNKTHIQEVGTGLSFSSGLKGKEDIIFYMDKLPELFKQKKIEKDEFGQIVFDTDGLPKTVVEDGVIQYDGWNPKGQALLKEAHKMSGKEYGFKPTYTKTDRQNALKIDNTYLHINQAFLDMKAIESGGNLTTEYLKTFGYGDDGPSSIYGKGGIKQFSDDETVLAVRGKFENGLIKQIEKSQTSWDYKNLPSYIAWKESGHPHDRALFVGDAYNHLVGLQEGYLDGEYVQDVGENLIAGKWNQGYDLDLAIGKWGQEFGTTTEDGHFYFALRAWKGFHDVDPMTPRHPKLLNSEITVDDGTISFGRDNVNPLSNIPDIGTQGAAIKKEPSTHPWLETEDMEDWQKQRIEGGDFSTSDDGSLIMGKESGSKTLKEQGRPKVSIHAESDADSSVDMGTILSMIAKQSEFQFSISPDIDLSKIVEAIHLDDTDVLKAVNSLGLNSNYRNGILYITSK